MRYLSFFVLLISLTGCFETQLGEFKVKDVYAFATAPNQKNGAVFMTILSNSDYEEKIVSAESDVAEQVELHSNNIKSGKMNMRPVDSITVPKVGGKVLEPMGDHIMLIGLKKQLIAGESFTLYLHTKATKAMQAAPIEVEVKIVPPGKKP